MDLTYFIAQLKEFFIPADTISILVTFFLAQRVKRGIPKDFRPWAAIAMGFVVALAWALYQGGWNKVVLFGLIYGAGAIALYMVGFGKLIKKLPGGKSLMGE